nr:hypothetical protein [Anaerolineae bacterium]
MSSDDFVNLINQYLPAFPPDDVLNKGNPAQVDLFRQAYDPQTFYHQVVTAADEKLWQSYELLRNTFSRDVLVPKSDYVGWYKHRDPNESHLGVLMGRYWRVGGLQQYDKMGQLQKFSIDPLTATDSIAAVSNGSCISLEDVGYPGLCIGAIGYLATRPALRKKKHGILLYQAVEAEIQRMATEHGWQL